MNEEQRLEDLGESVKGFPKKSGVYLMRDANKKIIYIGKAKDLRLRVRSYFTGSDERYQVKFLLKRVESIDFILTDTEEQAFILERDLVNKHKPKYNIRLKDDKAYLSIRIDENANWPKLDLVRRVEQDSAHYFGPYSFAYEVRELLDVLNRLLPLRSCSDTVFYNRQRPCLEYQIKRCAAPCCLEVDRDEYSIWVKQAISFLEGRTDQIVSNLEQQMDRASEELRFEDAALIRDRLAIIEGFMKGQKYISSGTEDRDVFSMVRDQSFATISVLKVRSGRIADNQNYSFKDVVVTDSELLETVIAQYYQTSREIPEEIIVPFEVSNQDFLRSILKKKRTAAVKFFVPKQGLKFRVLQLAAVNARQHYITSFDSESRALEQAKALAKILDLSQIPRRIECIDISNLQGSDIVGALVVFFDGQADKSSYKRYKISQQGKPDDFAAIYEVVMRRLTRGFKADDLPDLLIIDGGKGQLQAALAARDELGLALEIVALAKARVKKQGKQQLVKKPERIFIEGEPEPIVLEPHLELTHFVARIRDEVHRYVISFHRQRRSKRVLMSILDEVPGIGPERKRRLFTHFGSIKKMKLAETSELAEVGRMPESLAKKLKETLSS